MYFKKFKNYLLLDYHSTKFTSIMILSPGREIVAEITPSCRKA
jgi:hypothetical protein